MRETTFGLVGYRFPDSRGGRAVRRVPAQYAGEGLVDRQHHAIRRWSSGCRDRSSGLCARGRDGRVHFRYSLDHARSVLAEVDGPLPPLPAVLRGAGRSHMPLRAVPLAHGHRRDRIVRLMAVSADDAGAVDSLSLPGDTAGVADFRSDSLADGHHDSGRLDSSVRRLDDPQPRCGPSRAAPGKSAELQRKPGSKPKRLESAPITPQSFSSPYRIDYGVRDSVLNSLRKQD